MSKNLSPPILYLITRGATSETTSPESPEFQNLLIQIRAAAAAQIDLVQIREKRLNARVLFELAEQAVEITRGSSTRILVNDRADIAAGAGAPFVKSSPAKMAETAPPDAEKPVTTDPLSDYPRRNN